MPPPNSESPPPSRARRLLLAALVLLYGVAGIGHLVATDGFLAIVPDWVPAPRAVVIATGIAELFGAAGLVIPRTRRLAGVMLALYAVAVFPANVKHAVDAVPVAGVVLGWWYHAPRLAFQPMLALAPLWATGLIRWPFGEGGTGKR